MSRLDLPDLHGLGERLRTTHYGRSLELRALTDSTNDDARSAAREGAPRGHVVVADAQRRGRGSQGRTWDSPAGSDLYLSIVERLALPLDRLAPLTLAVGVGVAQTVEAARLDTRVKWPNDVWVEGRKIAGILVETSASENRSGPLVIGIGLGVNRVEWPAELEPIATSIRRESGRTQERVAILAALLANVESWVNRYADDGIAPILEALEPRLALRGSRVRCGDVIGVLSGLSPSGAICLETERGTLELLSGTLRPLE